VKVARIIRMCLNETYSKVLVIKHWADAFLVQKSLKQGDAVLSLLFNLL
jgi:hypothetical protein